MYQISEFNGGRGQGRTHRMLEEALKQLELGYSVVVVIQCAPHLDYFKSIIDKLGAKIDWRTPWWGRDQANNRILQFAVPQDRKLKQPDDYEGFPENTRYFWDHSAVDWCIRVASH